MPRLEAIFGDSKYHDLALDAWLEEHRPGWGPGGVYDELIVVPRPNMYPSSEESSDAVEFIFELQPLSEPIG